MYIYINTHPTGYFGYVYYPFLVVVHMTLLPPDLSLCLLPCLLELISQPLTAKERTENSHDQKVFLLICSLLSRRLCLTTGRMH